MLIPPFVTLWSPLECGLFASYCLEASFELIQKDVHFSVLLQKNTCPYTHTMGSWFTCYLCVCVLVTQLCLTVCNPMHWNPPGSSVHGILQARILEWVPIPFSRGSSQSRDQTQVSCITSGFFYCLSHQGSPRTLEPVAYPFSRGSSRPRKQTRVSCTEGRFFTSWATREVVLLIN